MGTTVCHPVLHIPACLASCPPLAPQKPVTCTQSLAHAMQMPHSRAGTPNLFLFTFTFESQSYKIVQTGFELAHSVALENLGLAVFLLPALALPPLGSAKCIPLTCEEDGKCSTGAEARGSYYFSFCCAGDGTQASWACQASILPLSYLLPGLKSLSGYQCRGDSHLPSSHTDLPASGTTGSPEGQEP